MDHDGPMFVNGDQDSAGSAVSAPLQQRRVVNGDLVKLKRSKKHPKLNGMLGLVVRLASGQLLRHASNITMTFTSTRSLRSSCEAISKQCTTT